MNDLRKYLTPLNLLAAGALLLLVFDLSLATRLVLAWHRASSDQSAEYNADLATYAQLQAQTRQLQDLPARLGTSHQAADTFFAARIPANDSAVVSQLGELASRNHVRLSRAQYTPLVAVPGLVELRIDATMIGEYSPVMHFINEVERDRTRAFFIIRSVTLTGQQSGTVNLRLRLTTYMRADAASSAVMSAGGHAATEVQ